MDEIGLFPLRIVLLPTEVVPLHIFEPRYRELIGECLDHDEAFGLVYADDEGLAPIGTQATVVRVLERFEDGRMNVVVQGQERFRLVGLTDGRSFQTGEIEPFPDRDEPATATDVDRVLELFGELAALLGAELEEPDRASSQLSFALAARLDFSVEVKLDLLQEVSERVRLRRLVGLLEHAKEAVAYEREVGTRAQRNGKAHPSA